MANEGRSKTQRSFVRLLAVYIHPVAIFLRHCGLQDIKDESDRKTAAEYSYPQGITLLRMLVVDTLRELMPEFIVYLAIPLETYDELFRLRFIQKRVEEYDIKLIIFRPDLEEIVLWRD